MDWAPSAPAAYQEEKGGGGGEQLSWSLTLITFGSVVNHLQSITHNAVQRPVTEAGRAVSAALPPSASLMNWWRERGGGSTMNERRRPPHMEAAVRDGRSADLPSPLCTRPGRLSSPCTGGGASWLPVTAKRHDFWKMFRSPLNLLLPPSPHSHHAPRPHPHPHLAFFLWALIGPWVLFAE